MLKSRKKNDIFLNSSPYNNDLFLKKTMVVRFRLVAY